MYKNNKIIEVLVLVLGGIVREPQGGDRLRTASQFAILDVDLICVSKFGYLEVGING